MPQIDLGSVVGPAGPQGVPGPAGADGVQGIPGPNQVTASTSSTLGTAAAPVVLIANGSKVGSRAFDLEPTAGSSGLLTSGVIEAALATRADYSPRTLDNAGGKTVVFTRKIASGAGSNLISIWTRSNGGAAGNHWVGLWIANFLVSFSVTNAGSTEVTATAITTRALSLTMPSGWGNIAITSVGEPLASIEYSA